MSEPDSKQFPEFPVLRASVSRCSRGPALMVLMIMRVVVVVVLVLVLVLVLVVMVDGGEVYVKRKMELTIKDI